MTESAMTQLARSAAAAGLLVCMVVGSLAIWTAIPAGWLWLGAHAGGESLVAYLIAATGAPPTMIVAGVGLFWLEARYQQLTGGRKVLENVLVVSAIVAFLALIVALVVHPPITPPLSH